MHAANQRFWEHTAKKYPGYFHGPNRILEVGSKNENGSVRDYFSGYTAYLGVDWRPGPGVDVVVEAKNMAFSEPFDTVISASMLEHDKEPELSIPAMVEAMRPSGILLLSWGSALNAPHYHETAVDGLFHPLPAGWVLNYLKDLGIHVHEFHYEHNLDYVPREERHNDRGCAVLVAFKDLKWAHGPREIDELLPEDK
jgi:SAM-dependent methyltransferase